jgi:predicted nucleic acid-binding protein
VLYLDTSVLVKCYFRETGSDVVLARISRPDQELFTSVLTFADVQSTIARKYRERRLNFQNLARLRAEFERDWANLFNIVELNLETMAELPRLLERYPLKAAHAVQLSAAIWLNKSARTVKSLHAGEGFQFGVADKVLADIAANCGLRVFNPVE